MLVKNGRESPRVAPVRTLSVARDGIASRSRRTSAVLPATTRRMNVRSSSAILDPSLLERLLRHHRLPPRGDARGRQPGGRTVRSVALALLLERLRVEIAEKSRPLHKRRELDGAVRGRGVLRQ